MKRQSGFILISWTGLLLLLLCCIFTIRASETPVAEHGVLDLRNWSVESKGMIELAGDWEF